MEKRLEKINASPKHIALILKENYLQVPTNQRNYAWKQKQVKELFEDLTAAMNTEAKEYFLGSIVVIHDEEGGENDSVVDGQQRLATTIIFLAAIRDYLISVGETGEASDLQKGYILTKEFGATEVEPHLRLNERDHEYFHHRVLLPSNDPLRKQPFATKPKKASHKRIDVAAKEAATTVKAIAAKYKPEQVFGVLTKWVQFLKAGALVVYVTVPDEGAAYTIFETMNDRGLALSATDLIKNYLFGKANTSFENVKSNWSNMIGTLDTVGEAEIAQTFVRHFWISQNGITRAPQLFDAIKKNKISPSKVLEFSRELSEAALKYVALVDPSKGFWASYGQYAPEIRKNLDVLKFLGVKQIRPILLAAMDRFPPKDFVNLIYLSVSWAVRLTISNMQGTGDLETVYSTVAARIFKKELKSIQAIAKEMKKSVPDDPNFQRYFTDVSIPNSEAARYYLGALERQFKGEPHPAFIPNDETTSVTIEHIMPKDFGDYRGEWQHIKNEIHEDYIFRLGNQVLLTSKDNHDMGSRGYPFKKPFLDKAEFVLTKKTGAYAEWGQEQIEQHQAVLGKLALATWPLTLRYPPK